jgi:hypothetical protein
VNHLADETSPYLLQHAGNPVDWYPWGSEALGRARDEDKPIFLSIGYSACHWCHVMAHESFEDPATAAVMNEHFVNVKVDREERPDLDSVYMDAALALNGSGGWPLSAFLTPEGKPFWAGTYLPPVPRHGMRSFTEVLAAVAEAWRDRRAELVASGETITEHLRSAGRHGGAEGDLDEALLERAVANLGASFDDEWGGWGGGAPKFPAAATIELLLRRGLPEMAEKTLEAMAAGGMYDLVGGGFHRYSVDRRWLVPHFEKMLYDNAQLAVAYLHGWQVTGNERFRVVAEETVDYLLRELALEGGGFASAQDADTAGEEGLTFTWTPHEGVPQDLLHPFEGGRYVLRGEIDESTRARLFALRELRPKPMRDDKAIASWNGLALAALAECARVLDRPDWLAAARATGRFLLGPLSTPEGHLHRTSRIGVAKGTGYLEDYADVANGLLELHAATGELCWLEEANRLARLAVELFYDSENGGFFQTPAHGEVLVVRGKELDDQPSPSGNSMLAYVLLRLARIYGEAELETKALTVFPLAQSALPRVPSAFGWMLVALDLHLSAPREIAIIGPPDAPVVRAALGRFDPRAVIAFGPSDRVALLEGKTLVDGRPAVYVCERFACRAPVTDASLL